MIIDVLFFKNYSLKARLEKKWNYDKQIRLNEIKIIENWYKQLKG